MRIDITKSLERLIASIAVMAATVSIAWAGGQDDPLLTMAQLDRLELRHGDEGSFGFLEGQGWLGQDLNKLWFKTEVERVDGETEEAELQALYSRAVAPNWDLQLGVRKDFKPSPNRNWGVIGVQGLAPYFFEINAALFIGESGRTAARLEAEYELLLTQKLILTPQIEANFYGQSDRELGIGSGLSDVEAGLRLRYEIRREFAPYIGVNWNRSFGDSADFTRTESGDVDDVQWVVGVRAWF